MTTVFIGRALSNSLESSSERLEVFKMRLLPMTNLIYFVFVLNLVHNSVLAFSTVTNSSEESVTDNFSSGLNVVFRAYEECNRVTFGEILTCLKLRALKLADRVLKSDTVQVIDGINIVKSFSKDVDRNGRRLNFKPLTEVNEAVLPTDPQQKQDKLNEMLVERVARFFRTHSVKFDLPRFVEESKHLLDGYTTSEGKLLALEFINIFILSIDRNYYVDLYI